MSIELNKVTKIYQAGEVKTKALQEVSLSIKEGEFVVLLGPSGSGKSTLLNICSGLDTPSSGSATVKDVNLHELNGKELTKFRRDHIGFIFQDYNLLTSLNVKENIELGSEISNNPLSFEEIIVEVGLTNMLSKYPSQLSGGEQQRVAISRAVIKNPSILFCDEPTGALDEENAKDVLGIIQKLNEKYNTTVVLITHNPAIGLLADKIIKMNSGLIQEVIVNKEKRNASDITWS